MRWDAPLRPADYTEERLITAILNGRFKIGDRLPAERELAAELGVTRPTLREVLQRMARDGWIEIRQGHSTRVRNYWQEGGLGVLEALARYPEHMPADFVDKLLAVRSLLAPAYFSQAVEFGGEGVNVLLKGLDPAGDSAERYAATDWKLHHEMTILSGNPIFTLILNGFESLYLRLARRYFSSDRARAHSRSFYERLTEAAAERDISMVERLVSETMAQSRALWKEAALDAGIGETFEDD